MIKLKNYSKMRIVLAVPLYLFVLLLSYVFYVNYELINYFIVVPFLIAVILFTLNKTWSDYVSFALFIFGFAGGLAFRINSYLEYPSAHTIFQKPEELWFIVITILVSGFLLINIIKKRV